jgi:uncharacterized membrane protein YraQ (UPF0718 family)
MPILSSLFEAIVRIVEMTWETWWALVLGFTLSGVVEVFVSEKQMTEALGGNGWNEIGLGMLFGAASSSCSYSATGTSKSLFKKGASGVASLGAFLFASTDLVIELGLVMWVLLGWQFVIGEYLGGIIATLVIATIFKHAVPQRWFDAARDHLHNLEETSCAACGMEADPTDEETVSLDTVGGTKYFCCGGCLNAYKSQTEMDANAGEVTWTDKLLTVDGWDTAAKKTIKEWEMLWEDIALGFIIAGIIAAFVPEAWWAAVFLDGGTFQSVAVNTLIGIIIGIVTFMCSVGNIPFALVLWQNGLPFGGILSFIYADLIIPPLVKIYRRYYGWRLAGALFGSIFIASLVAGISVHYLMGGVGLVPNQAQTGGTLSQGYTVVLNLLLTPVFLAQVYVAYDTDTLKDHVTSLPARTRAAIHKTDQARQLVGTELWEICLDIATALLLVGEAVLLLGGAVRTLYTAVRELGKVLGNLLGKLWIAVQWLL